MLALIHGPDIFRAQQYISEITISQKDAKIIKIDGRNIQPSSLLPTLEPLQLFSDKKILVIKNILSNKQKTTHEIIKKNLTNLHPDLGLIFWEQDNLDKRSWLYKFFAKISKPKNTTDNPPIVYEFKQLSKNEQIAWIKDYCRQNKIKIDPDAILDLGSQNNDSFFLVNELNKLKHYTQNYITAAAIKELTPPNPQSIIFDLTDQIGLKQKNKAFESALNLFKKGEDQFRILAALTTHIQNLLTIKDMLEKKYTLNDIKEKCHLHPYVIQKTILQTKNFTITEIAKLHHQIYLADSNIKSGKSDFKTEIYQLIFL